MVKINGCNIQTEEGALTEQTHPHGQAQTQVQAQDNDTDKREEHMKIVEMAAGELMKQDVGGGEQMSIKSFEGQESYLADTNEDTMLDLEFEVLSNGNQLHMTTDTLYRSKLERAMVNEPQLTVSGSMNQMPLEDRSFKQHTTWGGLRFKNHQVEVNFLDGHAILHKRIVYIGYALQIFLALLLLLQSFFLGRYKHAICDIEVNKEICMNVLDDDFDPNESSGGQSRWVFEIALTLFTLGMVFCGCVLHFVIHFTETIEHKSWAILTAWIIYISEAVGFCLIILLYRETSRFWCLRLFIVYVLLFTISIWFTGTLFFQNVLLFLVGAGLYYGLSVPIVLDNQADVRSGDYGASAGTLLYLVFAPMNGLLGILLLVGAYLDELTCRRRFLQRVMITFQQDKIIFEKTKNEGLQREFLDNILPPMIVDQLQMQAYNITVEKLRTLSQRHRGVSILFADLVGFTNFASSVNSPTVMAYLNTLFQSYDCLCDTYNVYKVETVGDCYVAAVGIVTGKLCTIETSFQSYSSMQTAMTSPCSNQTHDIGDQEEDIDTARSFNTKDMVGFAKAMLNASRQIDAPGYGKPLFIRVGMHTGPCMSGIVGTKNLRFCLFGDTMNTAARMEQNGVPDCIHGTHDVYKFTKEESWEPRSEIQVKGKGVMQTYLLRAST